MTVGEAIQSLGDWINSFGFKLDRWVTAIFDWLGDGFDLLIAGNFTDMTLGQLAFTLYMALCLYLGIKEEFFDKSKST